MGIQPDIIVCRSEHELDQKLKDKIALFCNVPNSHVLQNLDVEYLYEAPLAMEQENLAKVACECLNLDCPSRILQTGSRWLRISVIPIKRSRSHLSENIQHFTMHTFQLLRH